MPCGHPAIPHQSDYQRIHTSVFLCIKVFSNPVVISPWPCGLIYDRENSYKSLCVSCADSGRWWKLIKTLPLDTALRGSGASLVQLLMGDWLLCEKLPHLPWGDCAVAVWLFGGNYSTVRVIVLISRKGFLCVTQVCMCWKVVGHMTFTFIFSPIAVAVCWFGGNHSMVRFIVLIVR